MPKQSFDRIKKTITIQSITAAVLTLAVVGLGFYIFKGSHAAGPYTSAIPSSGTLAEGAALNTDTSAESGKSVLFGGASSTSSNEPMELLNRQSDVKIYPASAASSNGNYYDAWNPGTSTGAVEYDLSAVPATSRSKVILAWSTAYDNGYTPDTFMNGECVAGSTSLPVAYTIDVNSAAGGTSPPTTGWVNESSATNNIFYAGQSLVNMINTATNTPYNWIRMNITNSSNGIDLNFDLANASQNVNGDFLFIGDSITTFFGGHDNDGSDGEDIADLTSEALGNSEHIITANAGVSCTTSGNWDSAYSSYSSSDTIAAVLADYPGQYVTLDLGTNDAYSGGGSPTAYYSTMQTLADDIIAAGKTPIIPDIPWPNNGDGTAWDDQVKAFNTEISQLIASNPKIIAGPNMYTVLQDHPAWFLAAGNVHPNDEGVTAYRCAWAYAIAENVYKTKPSPISECEPYVSP
jgi:lysophospholipase L1-like esterase